MRWTFSGDRLAEMKALLPEYALKMMGLWRGLLSLNYLKAALSGR